MGKAGTGYLIIYLLRVAYDPALVEHLVREVISNLAWSELSQPRRLRRFTIANSQKGYEWFKLLA
jgi:hypothetical protein